MSIHKIQFTAQEPTHPDQEPRQYTFPAICLPTGEVCVPYENTHDAWFASAEDVEACGNDEIVSWADAGPSNWDERTIRESVTGSAEEFGIDAVPASLRKFVRAPQGE